MIAVVTCGVWNFRSSASGASAVPSLLDEKPCTEACKSCVFAQWRFDWTPSESGLRFIMMIFVKSLTCNTIALEVDLSDSLAGLRRRIQVRSLAAGLVDS